VTADEPEPYRIADGLLDLTLRAWINGELLGEDSLANCAFTFEELISFASRGANVAPGDLLASGTCQRGCLAEVWGRAGEQVPLPLAPGDVVTLEAEGIGRVSNKVIAPAPAPRSRRRGAASQEDRAISQSKELSRTEACSTSRPPCCSVESE
jgi:2-keto-4-pentenoate hydratase/2-oxohepta-3-ene-1,7-dioic acid hydratase in catechol pathway